jgi:hypothetical protein
MSVTRKFASHLKTSLERPAALEKWKLTLALTSKG